jgi:hypothetical protein
MALFCELGHRLSQVQDISCVNLILILERLDFLFICFKLPWKTFLEFSELESCLTEPFSFSIQGLLQTQFFFSDLSQQAALVVILLLQQILFALQLVQLVELFLHLLLALLKIILQLLQLRLRSFPQLLLSLQIIE